MAGVEDTGFVTKRLPDIINDLRAEAVSLFQDLVPPGEVVDTSDSSTLGRLIGLASPSAADLWEAAESVYAAFDPNSAVGIALDNLVAYAGIQRFSGVATTSPVYLFGDVNTTVVAGNTVSSPTTGATFTLSSDVVLTPTVCSGIGITVVVADSTTYTITYTGPTTTQTISYTSGIGSTEQSILDGIKADIDSNHPSLTAEIVGNQLNITRVDLFQRVEFTVSASVNLIKVGSIGDVVATAIGPIEQTPNTITQIVTPQLGWDSVTNPVDASPGRLTETDEELRIRFRDSKFERASNTLDSLYSALEGVLGIEQVVIYENDTDATDSNGVPPHSFLPIIVGGVSVDIAETIWDNKPAGIKSFGNTTTQVLDRNGFPHNISFSRPNPVNIFITMTLTTDVNFPANGVALIKDNLINYFQDDLGISADVNYSRLYTPINEVPGHTVDSLFIGTSASPTSTANIPIPFDGIASLSDTNIIINIT